MPRKEQEPEYPIITRSSRGPAFVGLAASTFHHFAKTDPTFPRKLILGKQMTAYKTADLLAWIETKRAPTPANKPDDEASR